MSDLTPPELKVFQIPQASRPSYRSRCLTRTEGEEERKGTTVPQHRLSLSLELPIHTSESSQQALGLGNIARVHYVSIHLHGRNQNFPYERREYVSPDTRNKKKIEKGAREREFEAIPSLVTLPDLNRRDLDGLDADPMIHDVRAAHASPRTR